MSALLFGAEAVAAATIILLSTRAFAALAGSASLRHLIRLGGFAALLLVPLFAAIFPSKFVLRGAPAAMTAPTAISDGSSHFTGWVLIGLAALWVAGVFVLLGRGLAGALALRALRRRSRPHGLDARQLTHWAARAGLAGGWALCFSAETQTPLSWGTFRPIVMLPEHCVDWGTEQLDAAMLHELAHLSRRDGLAQMVTLLSCALYWLHPLVWAEAKALRADAEAAADDVVILSGVKPSDYAELLLQVAGGAMRRLFLAGLELSMAERPGLETRIQSILKPNQLRSGVTKMQMLRIASFGVGTALLVALARPSFGADAPPLPIQPPAPATAAPSAMNNDAPLSKSAPAPVTRNARAPVPGHTKATRRSARGIPAAGTNGVGDHIAETVTKALAEAHLDEAVAKAVADAHIAETIAKALNDAHIDQKIAAAMKEAQPQIDAAIAQAQRQAQEAADRALRAQQQAALPSQ